MAKIEVICPGQPKLAPSDVAELYKITVERTDGLMCSLLEAYTAMSLACEDIAGPKPRRKQKAA